MNLATFTTASRASKFYCLRTIVNNYNGIFDNISTVTDRLYIDIFCYFNSTTDYTTISEQFHKAYV